MDPFFDIKIYTIYKRGNSLFLEYQNSQDDVLLESHSVPVHEGAGDVADPPGPGEDVGGDSDWFTSERHPALAISPHQQAGRVQAQLELGGRAFKHLIVLTKTFVRLTDHHGGEWLLFLSPLEGEGQPSPATEVDLLPVAEIVELVELLQVVEVDPVVESLNCSVFLLSQKDMFKSTGSQNLFA